MTDYRVAPGSPPAPASTLEPTPPAPGRSDTTQLRVAGLLVVALAVVGCVLGLVWAWWSSPGPAGEHLAAGTIVDETEAFIGADGRFLVLTAAAGLIASIVAWLLRPARGPWVAAALGIGGVAGALLTDAIGHLVRGASRPIPVGDGAVAYRHLALSVHATGLLLAEGALAALVYGLFVAFTAYDDLGRPDPVRDALRPEPAEPEPSVEAGGQPYDGGGHRDAAGPLQQGDLPPQ